MSYMDEYNALKKKRKENTSSGSQGSYMTEYNALKSQRSDDQTVVSAPEVQAPLFSRIAPTVGTIKPASVRNADKKDDKKWFQKGASEESVSRTILGTLADFGEDLTAGLVGMGEKTVDALAWLGNAMARGQYSPSFSTQANQAAIAAFDAMEAGTEEFIKKDLYDEHEVAKELLSNAYGAMINLPKTMNGGFLTPTDLASQRAQAHYALEYADNQMELDSVLAEKSDELVQSGGQLLGTAALSAMGIPSEVVIGLTSFGGETENALKQGATFEEAGFSAAVSAGAEILTEKISGGIRFGGKTLDDVGTQWLARNISNKAVRTMANMGMQVVGEGTEEVLSGYMSAIGQKLSYMDEKELKDIFTKEDAWDAFIGGGVLGGIGSATQTVKSEIQGVDSVTGMTKNEQKVVDKVYKDELAKLEKDGKVTARQKSELYQEVTERLEKGYFSTDTIEEVLGGEAYQNYRNTIDSEDAILKEFEELGKKQNATLAEQARYSELSQQAKDIWKNTKRDQMKAQLSKDIYEMSKGDRLVESYFENVRAHQKYEADLTQYQGKGRDVIQKVMESGLADNSNQTHEFWDMAAKIANDRNQDISIATQEEILEMVKKEYEAAGKEFDASKFDGKIIDGYFGESGIVLNAQTKRALNFVLGHEIMHTLEQSNHYADVQKILFEYNKGEYDTRFKERAGQYENIYDNEDFKNKIDKEVAADMVGDFLFTDKNFVKHLSTANRNVFQKMWDEVKYLYNMATAGSEQARQLEKVKKTFAEVYREAGKAQGEGQYSLSTEQQEYFKDSKVRDENGNLKVMYHGTPNGNYTVFKDGTYFTDNKEYADTYQNPGASSISTGKTATNPKTFEVYLDIKKPFDIADPEARSIYINDYIKGGNAMGINPYLPDAEYAKIDTIDWTEGEDLREFLIDNGYDYDGLVLDEGATGGYGDEVKSRGKSYVVFSPEQVKNIDNLKPTSDPDIRFSLSEAVEETKDLIAVHNLHTSELLETLKLSGLPSPSVAIIKAKDGHEKYGDVSLILPKDAIDPQADKANRIYGSDAWTPTRSNAQVEYEVNYDIQRQFERTVEELAKNVANGVFSRSSVLGMAGIEDSTGLNLNEIAQKISDYDAVKAAYVAENGGNVEVVYRTKEFDAYGNDALKGYIDKVGEQEVARLAAQMMTGERLTAEEIETAKDALVDNWIVKKAYALRQKPELRDIRIAKFRERLTNMRVEDFVRHAWEFYEDSGATTDEIDRGATGDNLRAAANRSDVAAWVTEKLQGLLSEPGIYNGKEIFTPSGKRRSFKETHWDYTAENIVRAMNNADARGANVWNVSGEAIIATATPEYKNIDEVRADKGRLFNAEKGDYEQIKDDISNELQQVTTDIVRTTEHQSDNQYDEEQIIGRVIMEAAQGAKTLPGIKQVFKKNGYRIGDAQAKAVLELFDHASQTPTGYFEAKPQRVVGFDEVGVFVIPNNADVKLKQELLNRGYAIAEYDPNIDGHRQQVVNQFEEYKFSLSNVGDTHKEYGRWNVYSKYVDIAPVIQKDAPVSATVSDMESVAEMFPDDLSPVQDELERLTAEEADMRSVMESYASVGDIEAVNKLIPEYEEIRSGIRELEADENQRADSLTDADAPPEMEAPYNGNAEIAPDPFANRNEKDVGSQKVKAYQYENPEVKPYFLEMAYGLAYDIDNSTHGERIYNDEVYYASGGEKGWMGTKRHTTDDIADLKDTWGYTWDQLREGVNDIIEDNGKENNAVSKRLEFLINDRLMNGYTDVDGRPIPPNQEYIDFLKERNINEYSKEAFDAFMANADRYAPMDIAPVAVSKTETTTEDIAPLYDATGKKGSVDGQQAFMPDAGADKIAQRLAREKANLTKDYQRRKAELQNELKDKTAYISNRALELYQELRSLKKGVKASDDLGYLLDYSNDWGSLRSALVNIRHNPDRTVNVNSAIESVARELLSRDYENRVYEISELEAEYQRNVEQLEADAENERSESSKKPTRKELHQRIVETVKTRFNEMGFDLDNVLKTAKNLSTFATVDNTPQRVMEKALGYKEGGVLADLTVNKVAQNETEGIKWLNSFTDRKNGMLAQISRQYHIKPGSKESAAAQMYAEGFYVGENNDIIAYGDAELAKDFPDANVQRNIKGLASDQRIRRIYDETLKAINESRTRNAYPEIPRLDNYFLHFRAMDDTFSRLGLPFNPNDIRAKDLPTDLNGVTADLKPGQPYFASAMHRTGKRTSFDLLGGLEKYLTSAKNQIYHIDDIQTLRALRNYIADTYGQANGLEGLDALSEEEAQDRIEKVYNSHLSTFAKFLNEEANILAGKTALIDRGLEGIIGRRGITFLNTVNGQVGSNMVGFNISSSLTNFLPVAQTFAKTNKVDFVKAFGQTVANKVGSIFGRSDSFTENSPVVIRRKGTDRFYRTTWQKMSDPGYALMSVVDDISTELIARTKYNELTRKGMDSQQAHYETDKWVSKLMGDRSLGQQPQLYNSKMLGLVTKFQLEVRNQLDSQFYDTIQEAKASNEHIQNGLEKNARTAAKVASTFVQLAAVQHLFGMAFESVAGYNPAFDIVEVMIKAFGWDDDEESEDTALDNIEQGFLALLEDLPYTGTFTGGRIPIQSALPIEQFIMGKDQYGNEKSRWETLGEVAPYYLMPGGYGQVKKTVQGLKMFSDDHPIAGSYTDSGALRFPVEDTLGNKIQAGIFGQWANENAQDYIDNGRKPLEEKQIQEFMDVDIPIRDYWEYREGLSGLSKLGEKADYIDSLDLPIDKKNLLINNIADREDPIDMTGYGNYDSFDEFDFAVKNPDKYEIAQAVGGYEKYMEYQEGMKDMKLAEKVDYIAGLNLTTKQKNALINGETDRKEPIDLTGYENYGNFEEFEYAKKNPENYAVAKAVGGYEAYKKYSDELYDIKADKDEYGQSISGSRKEKVQAYINGLDADYYTKLILYKSEYTSYDDENMEIINYLNQRNDISYKEMEAILLKLGFKVDSQGNIFWD